MSETGSECDTDSRLDLEYGCLSSEVESMDSRHIDNNLYFEGDSTSAPIPRRDQLDSVDAPKCCNTPGNYAYFDPFLYKTGIASQLLYEGASVTVLEALVSMFDWFTSHPGISKEALSEMLYLQHHTHLPAGNSLPDSFR